MYIKDDVCYAGSLAPEVRISSARVLRGRMLLVTFSTGERRLFDASQLVGGAFAPLAKEEVFSHPVIFHGVLTWDDGNIDVAPETVYRESFPYTEKAIV